MDKIAKDKLALEFLKILIAKNGIELNRISSNGISLDHMQEFEFRGLGENTKILFDAYVSIRSELDRLDTPSN